MKRPIRVKPIRISRDDPRIRKFGRHLRREAYELADNLAICGADLDRLRYPRLYQDLPNDGMISIQAQLADILMAILLSLPRSKRGPRPKNPTRRARQLVAAGMSKRAAARMVAEETGEPAENIRRRLREKPRPRKPRK
jgi:hypothetical protein